MNKLTDKEKALTKIISKLLSGFIRAGINPHWDSTPYENKGKKGEYYPHFAPWKQHQIGDLVLCNTANPHIGSIGIVKEIREGNYSEETVIQGVGGEESIITYNESYTPILGINMDSEEFLFGEKRKFYDKVRKVFLKEYKGNYRKYCFGGIIFNNNITVITIRPHVFYMENYEPFDITVTWNKKTTQKNILEQMKQQGYGTKYES